ncbi:MAG: homoserine dehydrogenase [Roseiflexaceae bacterium]
MMRTYRVMLSGLGNVGRSFLELIPSQADLLASRYGIALLVVAAADSGGAAIDPAGLDVATLIATKQGGQSVASLADVGKPGMSALDMVQQAPGELLLESTLTNLRDGQPGLGIIRAALTRGIPVVSANKGPLVLAYDELIALAEPPAGPGLRYSACVGGYLPTVNMGRRDLAGARIERIEAVLNGTTQGILRMMEAGGSYADALAEMQRRGLAEADPTLDVEGWDAANKVVILANAVLQRPTRLTDVEIEGITRVTADELREAQAHNARIVLLGLAEQVEGDYRLSVRPTALPIDHPLARMSGDEMGIVYYTDIGGRTSATTLERGPQPTAAAMLRDLIDLVVV